MRYNYYDSKNKTQRIANEIKVHWVMEECGNILRLLELYEDSHNVYLVLEYQELGTLVERMQDTSDYLTEK